MKTKAVKERWDLEVRDEQDRWRHRRTFTSLRSCKREFESIPSVARRIIHRIGIELWEIVN